MKASLTLTLVYRLATTSFMAVWMWTHNELFYGGRGLIGVESIFSRSPNQFLEKFF